MNFDLSKLQQLSQSLGSIDASPLVYVPPPSPATSSFEASPSSPSGGEGASGSGGARNYQENYDPFVLLKASMVDYSPSGCKPRRLNDSKSMKEALEHALERIERLEFYVNELMQEKRQQHDHSCTCLAKYIDIDDSKWSPSGLSAIIDRANNASISLESPSDM